MTNKYLDLRIGDKLFSWSSALTATFQAVSSLTSKPGKGLDILEMSVREGINHTFCITVKGRLQKEHYKNREKLIGSAVGLQLELEDKNQKKYQRFFHGYISDFMIHPPLDEEGKPLLFEMTLRPRFWFLTHTRNFRIFQKKDALACAEEILKEKKIEFDNRVSKRLEKRDFCVQYGESDFTFISRLLEEEGLFYHFECGKSGHTLVIEADAKRLKKLTPSSYDYAHGVGQIDEILSLTEDYQMVPNKISMMDFYPEKPENDMQVGEKEGKKTDIGDLEIMVYPGKYDDKKKGDQIAKDTLTSFHFKHKIFQGRSCAPGFVPGKRWSLKKHNESALNQDYILLEVTHTFSRLNDDGLGYTNGFRALSGKDDFCPARVTPKPVIHGVQTATVMGPDKDVVYTDEHGQIKVKFHWDREKSKPEETSCWIRVAQSLAGASFGGLVLPRVGEEVIVSFENGDPDRPLIVGSVYNGTHTPPSFPPGKTPKDNPTKMLFFSQSLDKKKSGKKGKGHQVVIDDTIDKEKFFLMTPKDLQILVMNAMDAVISGEDATLKLEGKEDKGGNLKITLEKGDKTLDIQKGQRTVTIEKNDTLTLNKGDLSIEAKDGKITIKAAKDMLFDAKGDITLKSQGKIKMQSGKDMTLSSKGKISLSATQALSASGQKVSIDAKTDALVQGKTKAILKAVQVVAQGNGMATLKSPKTSVAGDGMCEVKGGIVKIN